MCNRKFKKDFVQPQRQDGMPNARIEITCQPEASTFRDEGGRANYLYVYFVIRSTIDGLPESFKDTKSLPVDCELEYEDGTPVPNRLQSACLKMFGNAGTHKVKEEEAHCNCKTLRGSVRYKIMKLSRNHDSKRFRVKLSLRGISEDVVAPAFSRATLVLSKRKWLKVEERQPEIEARKSLEEAAERENIRIAEEVRKEHTKINFATPIRELMGMTMIESRYPKHAGIESLHAHAGEETDEDESSEYSRSRRVKKRAPPVTGERQSARVAMAASVYDARKKTEAPKNEAMFEKVLGELVTLQDQIEMYNETVVKTTKRINVVEAENRTLKRKVEALEDALSTVTKQRKFSSIAPLVQLSGPLDLPRSHSLAGPEDSGYFDEFITDDAMSVFEPQESMLPGQSLRPTKFIV
mmetsp:Transcript_19689/g.32806  ORF Transcript_19689/g.32806 Transcript_19689/m.32806 type:complete len:410 (-) Transcript_19689:65-1294(-)